MGRELGLGSSGKGMRKSPVPMSLPEDTEGHSERGVLPPSCREELSRCILQLSGSTKEFVFPVVLSRATRPLPQGGTGKRFATGEWQCTKEPR